MTKLRLDKLTLPTTETSKLSKLVVLSGSGAYSPVHNGHVEMFDVAKKYLEERGFFVCGGYLTPAHDAYTRRKLGKNHISLKERVEMIKLAVRDHWLEVDDVHLFRSSLTHATTVKRLQLLLEKKYENINIRVFYVCGADHFITTSMTSLQKHGVVVVNRVNSNWNEVRKKKRKYAKNKFLHLCKVEVAPVSSSAIRKLVREKKKDIEGINEDVVKYILKKKLLV